MNKLNFSLCIALSSTTIARQLRTIVLIGTVIAAYPVVAGTDKDTVRWDDRAGQWVYTLFNPSNLSQSKEERYTPRSLIEPKVKSSVQWDKNVFEYRYRVRNTADARQAISSLSVRAPKWDATAPLRSEPVDGESHAALLARVRAGQAEQDKFVSETLYSPKLWRPFLNVNRPTRVIFGWLASDAKGSGDNAMVGIKPRSAEGGFSVLRTELPGAGWMEMQGDTPDIYNAAILPRSGALADQVSQVLTEDFVLVPVMLPAIVVPVPYNVAELARRIKAHVATWPDSGLMTDAAFAAVGPKFDALITAAAGTDKKLVRDAAVAVMTEAFKHHPGMTYNQTDDDADEHDGKSPKRIFISPRGVLEEENDVAVPMHRVAARALVFNLMYLLARSTK